MGTMVTLFTFTRQHVERKVERHTLQRHRRWARWRLAAAALVVMGAALAQAAPQGKVVLDGLNGPQDVLLAPDGTLYVAENGTGPTASRPWTPSASVIELTPDGTLHTLARLPSLGNPRQKFDINGAGGLALLAGKLYATSSRWTSGAPFQRPDLAGTVVRLDATGPESVADTYQFELFHNPDQLFFDSHPYRLAAGPQGKLWVTDAAGNDLVTVDPETGKVSLVAAFPGLPSSTPSANRNGAYEIDPVPTGLVVRNDGSALVALMSGGAFPDGASKIVEVAPGGTVSDYVTGLTAVIDLKRGPDKKLYAVELAHFRNGDFVPGTGSLLRLTKNGPQTLLGGLNFPTSVAFSPKGDAYLAVQGVGRPGSGEILRFAHVAAF